MFKKSSSANEIAENLAINLRAQELVPTLTKQAAAQEATELLIRASERLDEAGFERQAGKLLSLVDKLSWYVPTFDKSVPKSSEQAVKNIAEKGTMFNANDGVVGKKKAPKADVTKGSGPKGLTNQPHSGDLSTGLSGPKMVDSLGPGQRMDVGMDDDADMKPSTTGKPSAPKAKDDQQDPEKPFAAPKNDKPATTPVIPVGVDTPKPDQLNKK